MDSDKVMKAIGLVEQAMKLCDEVGLLQPAIELDIALDKLRAAARPLRHL